MHDLAERIRNGDPRALARGLSAIESLAPESDDLLAALHDGAAWPVCVGITGAPGVGKSALVDGIAAELRRLEVSVAILAVDPSSPFSGGAVLGDRLRMGKHHQDAGVFIRSMASRGDLGGLAPAVGDALTLLAAADWDVVLIETVGVGQSEVDVMEVAETVVVVVAPGLGDDVQVAKAGLMEIADLFVINKSDLAGADDLEQQILAMISLIPEDRRKPPVFRTDALRGTGVASLIGPLRQGETRRLDAGYWGRRLRRKVGAEFHAMLAGNSDLGAELDRAADSVAAGELNPYEYTNEFLSRVRKQWMR